MRHANFFVACISESLGKLMSVLSVFLYNCEYNAK